ncbi:unnamed protein product [Closterium sp. NIES-54]
MLLHVAAQRYYELHSLDFSTAFLQGSLHEEIWLRRPPGFTGSFPTGPSALRLHVLLATVHSSAESVEPSGLYLVTCTRPDLAYLLSILARNVTPGRHTKEQMDAAKRVLRYLCSTSGMGLVLGGRARVVLTGHANASWELRWFTYLLTDLGEAPRSPPVLYVDNKAMLALSTLPCTAATATTAATAANATTAATAATAATTPTASMASPTVLTFDAERRAVDLDEWVDDLQLFLQCDSRDGGPSPSGVSQVDPLLGTVLVEVAVDSGAARGVASRGAACGGAEPARAEPGGAEPAGAEAEGTGSGGAEPGGAKPGGTELAGVEPGGAEPEGAEPRGAESVVAESGGAEPRGSLSPRGPPGVGVGGAGVGTADPRGVSTRGTGATGAGGAAGVGAGGTGAGAAGVTGAAGLEGARTRGTGAAGAGGATGVGAGGAGPGGADAVGAGSGDTGQPRPYFVPLLQQRVPLPSPLVSSLTDGPDPALVTELVDFATVSRLDYTTALVAESGSACPPSVEGGPGCTRHPDPALLRRGDYGVKQPPGSPPASKARYVARGFSQRQGVDFFLLCDAIICIHVSSTRRSGFTGSFPAGAQWSLRRTVYGLRQAPREWHDTPRTTLVAFGFAPLPANPSLFLCIDTSLPPFYVLLYVYDLLFATADTEALALSYMVQQILQRFGFRYSSPQSTPLPTGHSLSAPPLDESVEPSGLYPELVGCLMHLMTCTQPDLAYPLSILARYVAPGRHRPDHWEAAKRVLRYLCSTSGMRLVLGERRPVVLTGHADASWVDNLATQRSSQGYTFSLAAGSVSWWSTRSSSILCSIYNKAMIALCQEHRLEHRTKHIALHYFLARELQQRGPLHLDYVATRANTADIFTKALQSSDHQRFWFKLPMAALEGLNRPESGDSTVVVVAPGTTRGALHTSAAAPSLAHRPLFGQIPGFVQAQGDTSGTQRSRAGDTGPAAGASSSAADQAGAAACVTTAPVGQPGAFVRAPPDGAGQPGAYAGAPPAGAVQPGSFASALPVGARLPGAAAGVSPAAVAQPGAAVVIPTVAVGHPGAKAVVSTAAVGQPDAAAVIPIAAVGQPKAAAGVPTAAAGQPGSAGVALTAAAAQPCATAGAPKAAAGQHGPATGVAINAGHPTASVHLPLSSHGPGVQEPPAFLVAAEALNTGSILPGHTFSAPRGTLLNMLSSFAQPSQQVLPSPATSSSFMPLTQVGEEEEAASKGFTGVTKKKGKNEWVARIVLDRSSISLIVMCSHFQSEVAVAGSIPGASHVMFDNNPMRGDLIPLKDGDRAKLQGCTAQ